MRGHGDAARGWLRDREVGGCPPRAMATAPSRPPSAASAMEATRKRGRRWRIPAVPPTRHGRPIPPLWEEQVRSFPPPPPPALSPPFPPTTHRGDDGREEADPVASWQHNPRCDCISRGGGDGIVCFLRRLGVRGGGSRDGKGWHGTGEETNGGELGSIVCRSISETAGRGCPSSPPRLLVARPIVTRDRVGAVPPRERRRPRGPRPQRPPTSRGGGHPPPP